MQAIIMEFLLNLLTSFLKNLFSKATTVQALPAATSTTVAQAVTKKDYGTVLTKIPVLNEISNDVGVIQQALNKNGAKLDTDGEFGQLTQAAVSTFQKSKGLPGSGNIGEQTVKLLGLTMKTVVTPAPAPISGSYTPPSHEISGTRKLREELEKIVDDHLVKNHQSELKAYIDSKDGNKVSALFNRAMTELKVTEKTGNNDGTMVEYLQDTVGSPQKQSWCEDQQQSAIAYAEKKIGIKSRVPATESTVYVANNTPKDMLVKIEDSMMGDQWVWEHGTSGQGHTEMFDRWLEPKKTAVCQGGNTTSGFDPNGAIIRNGGGSFETHRSVGVIGDMHIIAVIRPFDKN